MACALTFLGVIMVFSATGVYASTEYNNSFFFLQKCRNWVLKMLLILQVQWMQTSKSSGSVHAELLPHGVEGSE